MSNLNVSVAKSPLLILCVGTGRDGTTSLAEMIQCGFDIEGRGRKVTHEWENVNLYQYYCQYLEDGNQEYLEKIRNLLLSCPYDCIVGNGYAGILPLFKEVFGDQLTLIHLTRRDKDACIASLIKNAELFPTNHMNYADSPYALGMRMAAFHFGEVTKQEWDTWSISKKFTWYYEKTHALIASHESLFSNVIQAETESLDDNELRLAISKAISGSDDVLPPVVHLNRHLDLESIPVGDRPWAQRFFGKLNIVRLTSDCTYGVSYAYSEFLLQMTFRLQNNDLNNIKTRLGLFRELKKMHSLLEDCSRQTIELGKSFKMEELNSIESMFQTSQLDKRALVKLCVVMIFSSLGFKCREKIKSLIRFISKPIKSLVTLIGIAK
jgi:hypothetical protein